MRVRHRFSMAILPLILLGLTAAIISCASAEAGPRAWIDWPTEGFETEVGTTVTVIAHAYAEPGVGEVRLEVDRQPYRVATPDLAGEQFVDVSMEWFADEPGIHHVRWWKLAPRCARMHVEQASRWACAIQA